MDISFHHVSEFSPDNKLFALIDDQGVLKIWDTETNELKQEYTPNLHLSAPCTCLTWVTVSQKRKKAKTKEGRFSSGEAGGNTLYLAMGTSKGGVVMYSFASSKLERNLKGEGHTARCTNIAYDNANHLYTCGEDGQILVWDVSEERQIDGWSVGNEKLYSIAAFPESHSVVVGGRQLKLYTAGTHELRQVFTGHTSDVTFLKHFTYDDKDYVLSTSKMERILCLWTVTARSKNKSPSCTFLMENIAYCISCKVDTDGNLQLAAVTRSGVVHFYVNALDRLKPDKPIKPKVTIQIASDGTEHIAPIHAIAAFIDQTAKGNKILLGYGDKQFLRFEYVEPNSAEKVQVLIRTDPKSLSSKHHKKELENSLKLVTPTVNTNDVEYKSATINRKQKKPVQIPMETRLQNLNLANGDTPTAKSKVHLLIQALHSKDANLLKIVLSTSDPKVIQPTLQKLPIQYVAVLVDELTQLMQSKRSNVQCAANWLKFLVRIHASQLMALGADDLLTKFGPCLGIIEHRMNCLQEISKLSGRLDLLINQIQRNTEEDAIDNENVLIYKDEDSANSEIEDEQSSSDEQWAEDDSEEEMDVN